jgi:hypothetical protein
VACGDSGQPASSEALAQGAQVNSLWSPGGRRAAAVDGQELGAARAAGIVADRPARPAGEAALLAGDGDHDVGRPRAPGRRQRSVGGQLGADPVERFQHDGIVAAGRRDRHRRRGRGARVGDRHALTVVRARDAAPRQRQAQRGQPHHVGVDHGRFEIAVACGA